MSNSMEVREHEEAVGDGDVNLCLPSPETMQCKCIICKLLATEFSVLPFKEKREIIIQGRPTPSLVNLSKQTKSFVRHFQTENYKKCEWLTGCENKSLLFCWPCLLFSNEKNLWNKNGFSDLNNFHKLIKRHGSSKQHIQAIIKEKTFGKKRIENAVDDELRIATEKHNQEVRKNRDIVKRLIDVVCFLGQHKLAFHGHTESQNSLNNGNYVDLLNLIAKYDKTLESLLENSTRFKGTSNLIQNELILCVEKVMLEKIKTEIEETSAIAIILVETKDISNISQLSKVVRYVSRTGDIKERFLGFPNVSTKRSAQDLYSIVDHLIEELECSSKLVAQSYDGVAVMAEVLDRLQTKVKEKYPSALFVHCMGHHLNLVLQQSLNNKKECKVFFSTLSGLAAFLSKSLKGTSYLDVEVNKRLSKVVPTRWSYNGRLVQTILEYREHFIDVFHKILDNQEEWDNEIIVCSRGYLDILERDANFNFLLLIFSEILPFCDNLFSVLENKINNENLFVKKVHEFKLILSSKRDQFENFWGKFQELNVDSQPSRKRIRTNIVEEQEDEKARRLFFEIIDEVATHTEIRFKKFSKLNFLELVNFDKNTSVSEPAFNSLKQSYPVHFDFSGLRSELSVIYNTSEGLNKKSAMDLLKSLKECGLDRVCPEVIKLCELTLTIPGITSTSTERSFSVLKRIESLMRNSTSQERLSTLGLLSIEKELLQEMSRGEKFYQDVIDEFAKLSRRIPLTFQLANIESTSSSYHTDPIYSQHIELLPSGDSSKNTSKQDLEINLDESMDAQLTSVEIFKEDNDCVSSFENAAGNFKDQGHIESTSYCFKKENCENNLSFTSETQQDQVNNLDEAINPQLTSIKIMKEDHDDDERNFGDQAPVESTSFNFKEENRENNLSSTSQTDLVHFQHIELKPSTISSTHPFKQDQVNNLDEAINPQLTSIKIMKEDHDDDEKNFGDQEYVETISYSFNENDLFSNYHAGGQHIDHNDLPKEVKDETATIISFHSFSQ